MFYYAIFLFNSLKKKTLTLIPLVLGNTGIKNVRSDATHLVNLDTSIGTVNPRYNDNICSQ